MPRKKSSDFRPGNAGVVEKIPGNDEIWWIATKSVQRRVDGMFEQKYLPGCILVVRQDRFSLYPAEWPIDGKASPKRLDLLVSGRPKKLGLLVSGRYDLKSDEVEVRDVDVKRAGKPVVDIFVEMAKSAVKHGLVHSE